MVGVKMRNGGRLLCGVATLALVGSQLAAAQETNEADKQGRVTLLQRLVVGAGADKVAIETPQAVSVVDQAALDAEQPETVGDAIDALPGVKAIGSQRVLGESFNIRGIGASAASDEPRLIVNVDGAPKFYEQYRMGSFFSDPELYKRIEVLRGPASSTLYGAGALAGVINLTTKDPADFLTDGQTWALRQKLGGTLNGGGAGFLTSSTLAWRAGAQAAFLLNGTHRQSDAFVDGSGNTVDGTDFSTWSGLAKGVFTLGPLGEHRLEASYSRWFSDVDDAPYSQSGLSGGVLTAFGTADRVVNDQTATVAYSYTPIDNPWIDFSLTGGYASSLVEQSDVSPGLRFAFGDRWDIAYDTWQLRAENTATMTGDRWENFLTVGAQAQTQDRVSDAQFVGPPFFPPGIAGPYPIGSHPSGRATSFGAFVQSEFVHDGWLTVIPGARVDHFRMSAGDNVPAAVGERANRYTLFSPKLAAHAQLNNWLAVFGSAAQTQRAPVLDELYDVDGHVGLKPERSNSFELGAAVSLYDVAAVGDVLQFKVTGFANRINDLIYRADDGDPYFNAPHADYRGVEVEAAYEGDRLFGRAAYSLIRGELWTGTYLDTIPADELVLTLGTRLPERDLEMSWTGTFAAPQRRVADPSVTVWGDGAPTGGYMVHDLQASWTPSDGPLAGLDVQFGIENVFDTTYREHLSGDTAPGRTFKLTLARQFGG